MNIKKKSIAIGTALLVTMLAIPTPPAQATTVTTPLSVTAIVGAVCSLTTTAVSFGSYDPIVANASTALNATGSISDTCSNGLSGTITLDAGLYPTGSSTASVPARQMRSGASVLGYFLYTDSARSNPWGSSGVGITGTGTTSVPILVYGQVPGGQNAAAGSYSDTVTATITF
jgi:spore coat protein U-like protein